MHEYKTIPAFIKAIDEDQGIVTAIFSVLGNRDEGNDIVERGAFSKTIEGRIPKIRVLDNHNADSINRAIGINLDIKEIGRADLPSEVKEQFPTATGAMQADIQFLLDTDEGLGAFKRIKQKAIDEWSFAYDVIKAKNQIEKDDNGRKIRVRHIQELKLWEISPVLWGMNQATTTVSAKSLEEALEDGNFRDAGEEAEQTCATCANLDGEGMCTVYNFMPDNPDMQVSDSFSAVEEASKKTVIEYQDLPLASRERDWDGDAAESRIREWAGGEDNMDWDKYAQAFFWRDGENSEQFGSYKLGYADIVDDELTAIPRGIFAVASVLEGGRGGVDIPEEDQDRIRSQVTRYYEKMADEFDDDTLIAPWDKTSTNENEPQIIEIDGATITIAPKKKPTVKQDEDDGAISLGDVLAGNIHTTVNGLIDKWLLDGVLNRNQHKSLRHSIETALEAILEDAGEVASLDVSMVMFDPFDDIFFWARDMDLDAKQKTTLAQLLMAAGLFADTYRKAGRVLSETNANKIQNALDTLIDVLESAGVVISDRSDSNTDEDDKSLTSEEAGNTTSGQEADADDDQTLRLLELEEIDMELQAI